MNELVSIPTPERPRRHDCGDVIYRARPPWGYVQCTCGRWYVSKDKWTFWDAITFHIGHLARGMYWVRRYRAPRQARQVDA